MLRLLFLLSITFHVSFQCIAQDTLMLMNGRELGCNIIDDSGTVFIFELTKKSGKVKVRDIHKSDVFSVKRAGGTEEILYAMDEFLGEIYTVDEMRFYLAGEHDARENFDAWPTFIVGFVVCGASGYLGQDGFFTAIVPPLAYTLLQLAPKIKIRESTMSSPNYKHNDIYADGYEPPARSRKIFRALQGSLCGSATGILTWLIFFRK